jgi:2'-hydroxyisoflavone reductase
MELPLWLHDETHRGMLSIDPAAAFAAGLETRPLAETVRDTLAWVESGDAPADPPAGLDRDKEQRVLDAWLST